MEDYFLEKQPKTPAIEARANGHILIEGICIPENVPEFFHGFITWFNSYNSAPAEKTVLEIKLAYFNTTTAAVLLNIFRTIAAIKKNGKEAIINWYYEEGDYEIQESGYDYAGLLDVEFNVLSYVK